MGTIMVDVQRETQEDGRTKYTVTENEKIVVITTNEEVVERFISIVNKEKTKLEH